ncbi:hypothetical protein SAMN05428949_0156 [Chitinophaga sp. YR627]|uniref:contractile injection system tape measure protein n=1 Tax=Chitinophaga sp. YR627 TaxID=1881041 RepID=UPI0008F28949|nr:contractile injection system tape measure protein [Chitinophaga sp. YR627]SFM60814.1 hypothetical protein SAMN05428949_0156 [Chitinophaga sp. YR627]
MIEQQHAIGKLVLEVQLPSRDDAFSIQQALSVRCNVELTPMLGQLLDSWSDPDTLLQIDKLEIDLGSCNLKALQEELPGMVIAYLQKHFQGVTATPSPELNIQHLQRRPLTQGYFESWLYFMQHGVLPSTAVRWEQEEWEAGILTALATETSALKQCQELLTAHPYAVRRLVMQFSRSFVYNWVLAFSAGAYRQQLVLIDEWEAFVFSPRFVTVMKAQITQQSLPSLALPEHSRYATQVMEWLIGDIVIAGKAISHPALLEQLVRLMGSVSQLPVRLFTLEKVTAAGVSMPVAVHEAVGAVAARYSAEMTVLRETFNTKPDLKNAATDARVKAQQEKKERLQQEQQLAATLRRKQEQDTTAKQSASSGVQSSETPDDNKVKDQKDQQGQRQSGESTTAAARTVTDEETVQSEQTRLSETENGEESATAGLPEEGTVYYINNAGLILLHPYLSYCFDALELREGQQFKDEAAKHKAVQLIGYMAYGEEEIPEWDLVLPKILCGISPTEPVRRFVPLSEAEKDEANQLLSAVITHWNALGNTSPDGLRGNFLLREGKLEWKEEEWQLFVTQQAYDMLLNRLPWGFSVVGLSWMPWLIKTVWV